MTKSKWVPGTFRHVNEEPLHIAGKSNAMTVSKVMEMIAFGSPEEYLNLIETICTDHKDRRKRYKIPSEKQSA